MSCFIVEGETIENGLQGVLMAARHSPSTFTVGGIFPHLAPVEQLDALGAAMLRLNFQAYAACYPNDESNLSQEELDTITHTYIGKPIPYIQAYKSLSCFLYQCSEGTIPEQSALFKDLSAAKAILAEVIVSDLPEYNAAKWG